MIKNLGGFRFLKKCLSYNSHIWKLYDWQFFGGDTKNFSSYFENLAQKFFCFFFQPQIDFRTQTNIFRKKNFCMQNLIFCVHNVVLDTIKLAFIFFSLNFFSSKTLKIPLSFVWGVNVRFDQCLII